MVLLSEEDVRASTDCRAWERKDASSRLQLVPLSLQVGGIEMPFLWTSSDGLHFNRSIFPDDLHLEQDVRLGLPAPH